MIKEICTKFNTQSMIKVEPSKNYLFCLQSINVENPKELKTIGIDMKEISINIDFKGKLFEPYRGNKSIYEVKVAPINSLSIYYNKKNISIAEFIEIVKVPYKPLEFNNK